MKRRILALLMVALLCVGCLPEENRVHTVSFDGHEDAFEYEDTQYKAGQNVKVYFTAVGTDTDYSFFMNGKEIDPEYEGEKGYRIEFEMPANDVVISYQAHGSIDPAGEDDGMKNGGEDFAMNPQMIPSLVIDGKWYTIETEENATAGEFFKKVSAGELPTLTMTDYGEFEKNADLPWELSTDLDTRMMVETGDIVLYKGKTLALIYDMNTADYTKLGRLEMTLDKRDELKKTLKDKKDIKVDVVVEFTE